MEKKRFVYHLLALAVVAVWGVTFVCTKTVIAAGMHPAAIFFLRFVLAYAGVWVLTLGRPATWPSWCASRRCLRHFLR